MFNENELIKKIRGAMKLKQIGYKKLEEKTGIHHSRLEWCLNNWSRQSLTLSDLALILNTLHLHEDIEFIVAFNRLPPVTQKVLKDLMDVLAE